MRRPWTDDEIETVRINYPNWPAWLIAHLINRSERAVYMQADAMGLKKADDFFATLYSGRLCQDDPRGRGTRFQKGRKPEEARNYQPIGTLRVCRDGYLERKVSDDQSTYPARRWRAEHLRVW